MNTKLNNLLMFVAGVAIGSVVTWKVVEAKYERYLDEMFKELDEEVECDFVERDDYEEEYLETQEPESHALEEMRNAYNNISQEAGYAPKEEEIVEGPYIISGDEFDNNSDYNKESLNWYEDGVLTDIGDDVIDFAEDLIGDIDPSDYFSDSEIDTVYVRNEETKCDYEILRDTRKYNDLED